MSGGPVPVRASAKEARVERLIGRRVLDLRGRSIGRLEEIRAEPDHDGYRVSEYLIGSYGLIERLAMTRLWRRARGYRARWDQIDLSDPDCPRLTCPTGELVRETGDPGRRRSAPPRRRG